VLPAFKIPKSLENLCPMLFARVARDGVLQGVSHGFDRQTLLRGHLGADEETDDVAGTRALA